MEIKESLLNIICSLTIGLSIAFKAIVSTRMDWGLLQKTSSVINLHHDFGNAYGNIKIFDNSQ